MATDRSAAPEPPHRLSEDLELLLAEARGRKMSIREIEQRLKGRGVAVLIILMSVPFVIPVLPGVSTPFGIAIALIGLRLAFRQEPWLPGFIVNRELEWPIVQKLIGGTLKFVRRMERIVKPRMHFLEHPGMLTVTGLAITAGGLFLSLPLPIPFSNTLPALSTLLLAAGMMERDGALVIAGYVSGILAWVFLAAVLLAGRIGFHHLF